MDGGAEKKVSMVKTIEHIAMIVLLEKCKTFFKELLIPTQVFNFEGLLRCLPFPFQPQHICSHVYFIDNEVVWC